MVIRNLVFFFIVGVFFTNKNCQSAKILKMTKNFCKDLRDCSIYFPCSYFITGFSSSPQIQQCQTDFVFDENKQMCVKPQSRDDFQCLLASNKVSLRSNINATQTTTIKSNIVTHSTLANELITIYEQSFGASPVSNRISLIRKKSPMRSFKKYENNFTPKMHSSLKKKKNVDEEYEYEGEENGVEENEESEDPNQPDYKRMCIVTDWAQYRKGKGQFKFEYINIHLCNHIIFSTVVVSESEESDEEDEQNEEYIIKTVQHNDLDLFAKLASFKARKPDLKLILRIGDDNGRLYSKLSKKTETRSNFIKNTLAFIKEHNFDGIEIDWKWPCGQSGSSSDKQNLPLLLKDFKSQMTPNQILGMIISPLTDRIQKSYSLLDISRSIDYVNIEAYDYYGPWDRRAGINAPLFKMDEQFLTEAFMNIEGTVTFLKALGLSNDKMVLGIAAYARAYILQDSKQNNINSPTADNGFSGGFTKINGLLSYYEVCERKKRRGWKEEWQQLAMVPYMYNEDNEWVSFENEQSLNKKIEFMKNNGMAGVSINSIDMDDFRGSFCDSGPYPFLRASLGLLMKNSKHVQSKSKKNLPSTTEAITTPTEYYRPKTTTINIASTAIVDENDAESTIKPLSRVISKKKIKNSKTSTNRINKKSEQSEENVDTDKHAYSKKVNAINKIINSKLPPKAVPNGIKKNKKQQLSMKPVFSPDLSASTNRNDIKQNSQSQSYFLITPPPSNKNQIQNVVQIKKMDPNEENYWKHELKMRQELKNQEQLRIQQEMYQKEFNVNPPQPNEYSKPHVLVTVPTLPPPPSLPPQTYKPPIMQPQFHVQPHPQNTQQNILNYNQALLQQQELELRHKQQLEEYETQRKQNQQLELQQQQLKKLIADQQWQLQQSKHQQAEQWVKDLQANQARQNEQIELQNQHQQQIIHQQQQLHQQHQQQQINYNVQTNPPPPPYVPPIQLPPPPPPAPVVQTPQNIWNQPMDNKCSNKPNGIYRDEFDCRAFYVCETASVSTGQASGGTRTHKFSCPTGLTFSMTTCTCGWPGPDSPCVVPLHNSFCKETGAEKKWVEPVPAQTVQTPIVWYSGEFSCQNKQDGLHIDPYDCTKFYYCQLLTAGSSSGTVMRHEFKCPSGLHFSSTTCQCDWPKTNGCTFFTGYSTFCAASSF